MHEGLQLSDVDESSALSDVDARIAMARVAIPQVNVDEVTDRLGIDVDLLARILEKVLDVDVERAELALSELSEQEIDDLATELGDLQTSIRQFLQLMKF